jgi:hypothetical protein
MMLSVLLSAAAAAQPSLSVRLGGAFPFSLLAGTSNDFLHDYWPVGVTGELVLQERLYGFLDVEASIEHDLFLYHHYMPETVTGDASVQSSSGLPAQITRFGVNLRLSSSGDTNKSKPFLLFGGGYTVERYGRTLVEWLESGTASASNFEYPSQDYWAAWFGFGAQFALSSILILEPTVMFRFRVNDMSFVGHRSYGTVALQLVYRVIG